MLFQNILDASLVFGAILLIAALSGLISEKAGVVNIGINGMMIIGALSFSVLGHVFKGENHTYTLVFSLIIAGLIAAIFALIHGFATIVLKADHVVSGTAINLLAAGIGLVLTPYFGQKLENQDHITMAYGFKNFGTTGINPQSIIYIAIALMIAASIFVYFKHTKFGLRHSAVGENPNAADSAAIKVNKYKWIAVTVSGFLAGIAGSIAVFRMNQFNGNVQGLGFVALAIMIIGQWKTVLIIPSAIVFALIYGWATYVGSDFPVPQPILRMLPFVLSLVALVGLSKFQAAPKAAGAHFDKSKR